jgi:hypothetical protein
LRILVEPSLPFVNVLVMSSRPLSSLPTILSQ